ncbi:MAG: hypothetical protein PHQ62_02880 [Clostridia bacterium]|nr:hypothetical protein [Clostridia bacterium]
MTVKNILKIAVLFLNKKELLTTTSFDDESITAPTTEQANDINLLTKCFNFIYKEVASSYLPLFFEEEIVFVNGKFEFANLQNQILEIHKLTSKNGNHLAYELFPSYVKALVSRADLVYSYLPQDFDLEDSVNMFGGKVLPQVLASGVARKFCLLNEDYSTADIWEKKFKDGIFNAISKKSNIRLRERRWN